MILTKYGDAVAENTRNYGPGTNAPGSVQPKRCAGCNVEDRMSIPRLADGRKYWVCDHCGYPHESEETQGTANGLSAYANPFDVGDFVREPGSWCVYRVTDAFRSSIRGSGYFTAVLVVDGLKYHKVGKSVMADASRYKKVDDPAAFIAGCGPQCRFCPDVQETT